MRAWITAALTLAASLLAGCEPYAGPTASCFALVEGEAPCDFRPVAGVEGGDGA